LDISITVSLFVFVILCFCTVTDFSGDDIASGVKFFTVVHRHPRQEISHFGKFCYPKSPKSDESASHREVCLGCISLPCRKRHAADAPFVEYGAACERRLTSVDIGQSPLTYLLLSSSSLSSSSSLL